MRKPKSKGTLQTSAFQRFFSGFIAAVMVLGFFPASSLATLRDPITGLTTEEILSTMSTNEDDGIAPILSNVTLPEETDWEGTYPLENISFKAFYADKKFDSALFQHFKDSGEYDSTNAATNCTIAIANFTGEDGLTYSGLCMDFKKGLYSQSGNWTRGWTYGDDQTILTGILDYYYAAEYTARQYELDYAAEAAAAGADLETWLVDNHGYWSFHTTLNDVGTWWYCSDHALKLMRLQAQIFLWWFEEVHDGSADKALEWLGDSYTMDPSKGTGVNAFIPTPGGNLELIIDLMAQDRVAVEKAIDIYNTSGYSDAYYLETIEDGLTRMFWFGFYSWAREGSEKWYDEWNFEYTAYTPPASNSSAYQRFVIPSVSREITGDFHAEVTVLKTDEDLEGLGGAVFTIYSDSACTTVVDTITTKSDGTGSVEIQNDSFLNPSGDNYMYYVKETTAPGGYVGSGAVWNVDVVFGSTDYDPPVTAINNGNAIPNTITTIEDQTPGKLQKKDAMTGELVGPATFRFEGYNYTDIYRENIAEGDVDNRSDVLDEVKRTYDMPVGSDGTLDLQWHDPTGADGAYIPPGQYRVTEIESPPHYEGTDEVQEVDLYVLLNLDTNVLQHEGPEVIEFTNIRKTTIDIMKLDNSGNGLEGAGFELWYASDAGWVMVDSGTTLADGSLTFGGDGEELNAGNYILKEIFAPEGYILPDKTEYEFTINPEASGTTQVQFTITNYKEPDLKVRKVDESGEGIGGAVIDLYINDHSLGQYTSNSDGWIILEAGTYGDILTGDGPWVFKCVEISPPPGYIMPEAYYDRMRSTFIYPGQESAELVLVNKPIPLVEFYKRCALTGEPLEGAIFNVTIDDHIIYGVMSDEDGKVTISYEEYGEYLNTSRDSWTIIVEEVSAPPGYMLSSDDDMRIQYGEIIAGQTYVTFIFENHPFPELRIYKKSAKLDANDEIIMLEGAVYKVTIDDYDIVNVMTDKNGELVINYEEWGEFLDQTKDSWTVIVEEVEPPPGYLLPEDPIQYGELHKGETHLDFWFSNEPVPEIRIYKKSGSLDEDGNIVMLEGAVYKVTIDDYDIVNVMTDENGELIIDYEDWGYFLDKSKDSWTVVVEEVEPPAGYLLGDVNFQYGELHRGETHLDFWFTNHKIPEIEILKLSADTNQPLKGALFDVWIDEIPIGTFSTDSDGLITITYKELGQYLDITDLEWIVKIEEIAAPAGYLLPSDTIDSKRMDIGMEKLCFVMYNSQYPMIEINKYESGTLLGLAGAVFSVKVDATSIGTWETDQNGKIYITYDEYKNWLPSGEDSWTITVEEISAPAGYINDNAGKPVTHELRLGQSLQTFVFENTKYPDITIKKVDREDPTIGLEGATFKLMIDAVEIPGPWVTNQNGEVFISWDTIGRYLDEDNLDHWTITATELLAPNGYNLDKQPSTGDYTITSQFQNGMSSVELLFSDTSYRSIEVTKKDSASGALLAGAEFTLVCLSLDDGDASSFGTRVLTTDATGTVLFENIPNGTYQITETNAPLGYETLPKIACPIFIFFFNKSPALRYLDILYTYLHPTF